MRSGDIRSRNANSKLGFTEKCTLRWQIRLKIRVVNSDLLKCGANIRFFCESRKIPPNFSHKTFPKTPIQMQKMARLFHFKKKITA